MAHDKVHHCLGVSSQIYSRTPVYRGYDLNCVVCQGTLGNPCDITPEELPQTVPCRGSCAVWRTLNNQGKLFAVIIDYTGLSPHTNVAK